MIYISIKTKAGETHTAAEVEGNLEAVMPAYALSCPEAETLAEYLEAFDNCHNVPAPDEKPRSHRRFFPQGFKPDLVALLRDAFEWDHSAAVVPVRVLGAENSPILFRLGCCAVLSLCCF
ncbi:hypothetical protein FPSE5266_20024 [Fusarium pseudograminearum]|nr:hypothetical protein FPSE5266_20024 [Fusarium pseudograminearum]